jgi:hypothetical protein
MIDELLKLLGDAADHMEKFLAENDAGQVKWIEGPVPKPTAMRSFLGTSASGRYTVLVVQANTKEYGIVHEGMFTALAEGLFIPLQPKLADHLYHLAAAARN